MNRSGPWSDRETKAFISIWGEVNIQEQLDGATRNMTVFVDISKQLERLGYDKDWQQCRIKVKNLKNQYKKLKIITGSLVIGEKSLSTMNNWIEYWDTGQQYWLIQRLMTRI